MIRKAILYLTSDLWDVAKLCTGHILTLAVDDALH